MSLKGFHIVFITLSVLCTLGFALWTLVSESESNTSAMKVFGIVSAIAGVGLLVYGVWFYKSKIKGPLVL